MPAPTNTLVTLTSVGQREDMSDVIARVQPEETPFYSSARKLKAKARRHEWQIEGLAAPAVNARLEGDDIGTFTAANLTTRVSNICQIFRKDGSLSRTVQVVDHAGRSDEMKRQKVLKTLELRRDMELSAMSNSPSRLESGSDARLSAGIRAWATTNSSVGATGALGGFNGSTSIVDAATPGNNRTFAEPLLRAALASRFTAAGNTRSLHCYLSASLKQVASAFTGISANRKESGDTAATTRIVAGADIYVSDFGAVTMIPHAYGVANAAIIVDPEYLGWATLDAVQSKTLAADGDNDKFMIVGEGTLVCTNERAHSVIHALT